MAIGFKTSANYGDFDEYFLKEKELLDRYVTGKIISFGVLKGDGNSGQSTTANYLNYLNQTKTIKEIYTATDDSGFAITSTGELWGWGANSYGILGNNSTAAQYSPVQTVAGGTNWKTVQSQFGGSGQYQICALKTDGTAWVWGCNGIYGHGTLGTNDQAHRSSPTQFMPSRTFKCITVSGEGVRAITTNGELWTAGYNNNGTLGINLSSSADSRSSPVQVGSDTNWKIVIAGFGASYAIKTDGTLWSWGYNSFGALGDNTSTSRSSPVQIYGGGTNWKSVHGHAWGAFAIKTDGSLWAWGYNSYGQLGTNDVTSYAYPRQIGGGQTWKSVVVSQSSVPTTFGLTTSGDLWTWGNGSAGADLLGDATTADRSSPVQVLRGRTWLKIGGGSALS